MAGGFESRTPPPETLASGIIERENAIAAAAAEEQAKLEAAAAAARQNRAVLEEELASLSIPQFDEQAFLMFNLDFFAKAHYNFHNKPNNTYSKINLLRGQNTALMNSLLNKDHPSKIPFLDLTQAQISQLVPKIRIFKQYYQPGSQNLKKEIEFIFPNYFDPDDILAEGRSGYGLVSFDIESQGTTFYTADKQFTAKLNLFFQTFDEITKTRITRVNGNGETYSFLDLIVQPFPNRNNPEDRDIATTSDPSQFRIRVDVGWANPTDYNIFTAAQLESIKNTRISFFLYLTDHDIQINQDGTVNLNISYIGAFDFINRDVRAGFILSADNKITYDELTKKVQDASVPPQGSDEPDRKRVEGARGALNTFIAQVGPESLSEIVGELMNPSEPDKDNFYRSKIYQTYISPAAKEQFSLLAGRGDLEGTLWARKNKLQAILNRPSGSGQTGVVAGQIYDFLVNRGKADKIDFCNPSYFFRWNYAGTGGEKEDPQQYYIEPIKLNTDPAIPNDVFETEAILVDLNGNEYTHIAWFYLGDLLEILMKRAFDESVTEIDSKLLLTRFGADFSKRIKMILSDIQYRSTCYGQVYRVNLAHIPISLKKFTVFFYNKVVTSRNLHYTMDDFIRDFINSFMKDIFLDRNTINNKIFKQNINLKYMHIAALAKDSSNPLPSETGYPDLTLIKKINTNNFLRTSDLEGNPANYYYYLMLFQDTYDPVNLKGLREEDEERGIPHIYTGRDRGIVKSVSFKKTALPYKREERIAQTNKDYNPIIQLSSLYNVDMETYGNTIFTVGSYFYLVPSGMGSTSLGLPNDARSISNIMGLGGYYFVNKITWSLESGKFICNISGIHQATGAPSRAPNGQITRSNEPIEING